MKAVLRSLFGENLKNLFFLNMLTVLGSLPVVTIGTAAATMDSLMVRLTEGEFIPRLAHEYWITYRRLLKKTVPATLLCLVYFAAMLWCMSVSRQLKTGGTGLYLISWFFAGAAALIAVWWFFILGTVNLSFQDSLWNALCLSFGRFPQSLAAGLIIWGMLYAAVLLYPASLAPYFVLFLAGAQAIGLAFLWKPMETLVLNRYERLDEEEETTEI